MTDIISNFTGIAEGDPTSWVPSGFVSEPITHRPLTADGFPMKPPAEWFVNPGLKGPTPLSVDLDGRVYGHLATWNQSHIGMAGSIKAPKSRSKYAFFQTGALETAEGQLVDVGQLTLAGGHASLDADVPRAVAHYDQTGSAVADIAVGEDKYGIWMAGALRPDVDDLKLRVLRASSVSGDWRPLNGNLELVAACSVNVPGFPIPRARVASGQVLALVAAGVEPLVEARIQQMASSGMVDAIDALSDRLSLTETALIEHLTAAGVVEQEPEPMVADARTLNTLRHRVYEPIIAAATAPEDEAARLRDRVHSPDNR